MPALLSLFLALVMTVGFFAGLYALILVFFEGQRLKAAPRLGLTTGDGEGTLKFWVNWDTGVFSFQVYRIRFRLSNPSGALKEMTFSYTFESPQKGPFAQNLLLPAPALEILKNASENPKGMLTVDYRTVENMSDFKDFRFAYVRQLMNGKGPKIPSSVKCAETPMEMDVPAIMSLDYSELVTRKKRLRDLEAAAKAKAAKAPPKPAPVATAAKPAAAAPAATPAKPEEKKETKMSIKEMIAATNAQEK